jgi:hypothetical protein
MSGKNYEKTFKLGNILREKALNAITSTNKDNIIRIAEKAAMEGRFGVDIQIVNNVNELGMAYLLSWLKEEGINAREIKRCWNDCTFCSCKTLSIAW